MVLQDSVISVSQNPIVLQGSTHYSPMLFLTIPIYQLICQLTSLLHFICCALIAWIAPRLNAPCASLNLILHFYFWLIQWYTERYWYIPQLPITQFQAVVLLVWQRKKRIPIALVFTASFPAIAFWNHGTKWESLFAQHLFTRSARQLHNCCL